MSCVFGFAGVAATMTLAIASARCGGTQGASANTDGAGVDATQSLIVGPGDDSCAAKNAFTFLPFASGSQVPTPIAGPYALYISYDTTGSLYQAASAVDGGETLDILAKGAQSGGSVCQRVDNSCCTANLTAAACATENGCMWDGGACPDPCPGIMQQSACVQHPGCEWVSTTGYAPLGVTAPQPRCGAPTQAFHLVASALTNWGMNFTIDLRQQCSTSPAAPPAGYGPVMGSNGTCFVDATKYDGISFWAYSGSADAGSAVLAVIPDHFTAGCVNSLAPNNDKAEMPCGAQGANGPLCDPFGIAVGLTSQWTFYAIPFSALTQKGYGVPESAPDLAHFFSFKLNLGKGDWDVWITDIFLYKAKTP